MRWAIRMLIGAVTSLLVIAANGLPGWAAVVPGPRSDQWWFAAWEVQTKVWPITQGRGVTVAVLDTGVQANIPELSGVVLPGTDATGGGGDGRTDVDDAAGLGHGTGMAGLIAAQGGPSRFVGVAPAVKILPVVVHRGEQTAYAKGIRYAVGQGAEVINLSQFTPQPCPEDVQEAVQYAIEHDVVVVAGAGNTGHLVNESGSPANCSGVLAVGGVDNELGVFAKTQRQPYVAVAAPATAVGSVLRDGQFHTSEGGTSSASALTSATVALVRSKYPEMSAREVVQRVIASARDVGPPGKDEQTGYGVVRPLHALQDKVAKNAPNPVFDAYDQWAAANKKADVGPSVAKEKDDKGFSLSPFAVVLVAAAGLAVLVLIVILIARVSRRPRQQPPAGAGWGPSGGPVPQQPGPPQQFGPPSFGQPPMGGQGQAPAGWPQPPAVPPGPGAPNPAPPQSPYSAPGESRQ